MIEIPLIPYPCDESVYERDKMIIISFYFCICLPRPTGGVGGKHCTAFFPETFALV